MYGLSLGIIIIIIIIIITLPVTEQQCGVWTGGRVRSASIDHTAAFLPAAWLKGPPSRVLREGQRVEGGQSATSCLAACCWQHTLPGLATANLHLRSRL